MCDHARERRIIGGPTAELVGRMTAGEAEAITAASGGEQDVDAFDIAGEGAAFDAGTD